MRNDLTRRWELCESEGWEMISPEEIKEIRKLVDAVTRGPWQSCNGDNFAGSCIEGIHYQNRVDVIVDDGLYDQHKVGVRKREDAIFIAAARTLVPRLLDEVERLQGHAKGLGAAMDVAVQERDHFKVLLDDLKIHLMESQGCIEGQDKEIILLKKENAKLQSFIDAYETGPRGLP